MIGVTGFTPVLSFTIENTITMEAQQQQYAFFAVLAVIVIGVVSFVFLNQKKPKAAKAEAKAPKKTSAPASTPAPASAPTTDAEGATSGTEGSKKKRKKRSKAKATTKGQVIAPVGQMDDAPESDDEEEGAPAKPEAPPAPKEAPKPKKTMEEKVVEELLKMDEKKNKDKKNKDNKKGNGKKSPVVAKMEDSAEGDESDEGEDAIFLTGKAAAAAADGWAVVEKKGGKAAKKVEPTPAPVVEQVTESTPSAAAEEPVTAPAAAPAAEEEAVVEEEDKTPPPPPVPVIEKVTQELTVEAKRLGLLIGVKGATRIAIQSATDTNIQMPKTEKDSTGEVTISVTGEEAGVVKAVAAMKELLVKGYCMLLADPDFRESDVTVHPRYLPDIIGKNGAVIKALGQHTGVKITVPNAVKTPGPDGKVPKVKIGLAGPKEKVAQCRNLVKEITRFYHTEVTHPNVVHEEMTIDVKYYNFIIGAKGSEIKHIQNSYKVSVHIPDSDSVNPNVLIVGEAAGVANAKRHIEKLIEKVDERNNPKPAEKTEDDEDADATPASDAETPTAGATTANADGEESWMKELGPPGDAFPATISPPIGLTKTDNGKPAWNTLAAGKTW